MMENKEKSNLFQTETVLRSHANVMQLLELDAILVNREADEPTRTAQTLVFIEKFIEGVSNARKI